MMKTDQSSPHSVVTPRRRFFRHLLSEAIGLVEEIHGKPQMRLNDLELIPDEHIRQMVPVFNRYTSFRIEGSRLLLKQRKGSTFQEAYRFNAQEMEILHFFDSQSTLEDIGRHVAEQCEQDEEIVYQQVKALFLLLSKKYVCHPAQSHNDMLKARTEEKDVND